MKLVFFNRYYWPDRSATSQLLTDLATALAAGGHEVLVVTGDREMDAGASRLPRQEREAGVEICRLRASAVARFGLFGRALDYVGFYAAAVWFALRHVHRGDIVIAKTDPPRQGTVLYVTAEVIRQVAILAQPFVPASAAKLLDLLAIPADERHFAALGGAHRIAPGTTLPAPAGVFPRYVEPEGGGAGA